uniref:Uncharacterized protein n=1 Tax=Marseillevirus LCMAC202 TaxID=2506606 RepID=A0A481YYD5_9VIRU|nr:MAG: hypothetical protein LCMAC202_05700 [Marseillevirus LCMAC202]
MLLKVGPTSDCPTSSGPTFNKSRSKEPVHAPAPVVSFGKLEAARQRSWLQEVDQEGRAATRLPTFFLKGGSQHAIFKKSAALFE